MNIPRFILDIIGTESVTDDGSDLTVTVNESRNHVMTGTMALTTEQNGQEMVTDPDSGIRV